MNKIKNMPKIIIQLNIKNFSNNLINEIISKINYLIALNNLNIAIKLDHHEQYWKIPEDTLCFLFLYSNEFITVKDFIKIFNVEFEYSSVLSGIEINKIICEHESESAIWSSNVDKNTFLDPNVTWAHIYNNVVNLDMIEELQDE